ncbi:Transcriptional activator spt7 [Coemansia brasiliensis]|uniref:Transcriptional activator spt7 n=1 Tax=Coemansia brasiliensis TaxID=2650707 RepID=A0A9W8IKH4_9FUNG|nr:Transcriptional activator spt7 [Coemansia brasiliensis]
MTADFSAAWEARSYQIAQRLQARNEWESYLTPKELPWLTKALESQELWAQFISPAPEQWRLRSLPSTEFELATTTHTTSASETESTSKRAAPSEENDALPNGVHKGEKRARTETAISAESSDDELSMLSGSDIDMVMWSGGASLASHAASPEPVNSRDVEMAEKTLACAVAGLRARSAIFEHYVSVLCGPTDCKQCTDAEMVRDDIKQAEEALQPKTNGTAAKNGVGSGDTVKPVLHRQIDEDEDYDDEPAVNDEPNDKDESKSKPETSATADSQNKRIVIRRVFRTLDELEDVANEQMEHEAQMRRVMEIEEQRAAEPKDMLEHKIGGLHNMRNLAQFIDKHRDSVRMTTRELGRLLTSVRPRKSKWTNERRVGQAELYEGLEHVLHELRGMGEAAQPFLSQVKRKEAPDYYKVIRQPMDLGAMAKNLRAEQYDSKRQFWAHLQLIRDNCYTYNTEPNNYYRRSADALLAKARVLMEAVPDVVVRDRDDIAADGADDSADESQSARAGSLIDDGTPAPGFRDSPAVEQAAGPEAAPASTALPARLVLRAGSAISDMATGYGHNVSERVWRLKARQRLREFMQQTGSDQARALGERHAAHRTGHGMRQFLESTHEALEAADSKDVQLLAELDCTADLQTVAVAGADAADARRRSAALDGARRAWAEAAARAEETRWRFVSESEPDAGMATCERMSAQAQRGGVLQWLNDDCEQTVAEAGETAAPPGLDAYAAARFPRNDMWRMMTSNLERLRRIREIDSKIWATKLNIPVGYLRASEPDDGEGAEAEAEVAAADPEEPLRMDAHGARKLLGRTLALMLAHAGFDAATDAALACLGGFVSDFINNIGRTLRVYIDRHGRTMSNEAILAHALYANGTEDLGDLEYYMRADAARYGNKLAELHRKLQRAFNEVVGDAAERPEAETELEGSDAFVTGMVGGLGDLGDDFFGFKELGLDREFGVEHLSVPQRLWRERGAQATDDAGQAPVQERQAHARPAAWAAVRGTAGHIGLLHAFIEEKQKQQEEESEALVEDESLPARQRYGASRAKAPPANCLTHPRTHMHVGSGQAVAERGAGAKKRPSKTTKKK